MLHKKVLLSLIVLLGLVISTLKANNALAYYTRINGELTGVGFVNPEYLPYNHVYFSLEEQYDILARGKINITGKVIAFDDDSILVNTTKENKLLKIAKNDIIKYEPFFKKKYGKLPSPSQSKIRFAIIDHKNSTSLFQCTDLKFINDTTFTCKVNGLQTNFSLSEVNSIFKQDKNHPFLLAFNCINLGGMIYTLNTPVGVYFMVSSLVGVIALIASQNNLKQPIYKNCTIIYNDSCNIVSKDDYNASSLNIQMFNSLNKNIWDIFNTVDNDYQIACKLNSLKEYRLFFKKYHVLFGKYPESTNKYESARKSAVKLCKDRFKSLNLSSMKMSDFGKYFSDEGLSGSIVQIGFSDGISVNRLVFNVSFYGENICQFDVETNLDLYSNSSLIKSIAFFDE